MRRWLRGHVIAVLHGPLARLEAVEREMSRTAEERSELRSGIEALGAELAAETAARLRAVQDALGSLDGHLRSLQESVETRFGQDLREIADLREAFFTVRTEFEHVRDTRLPGLEAGLDERAGALGRDLARIQEGVAGLQREVEGVRDHGLPALAGDLKDAHEAVEILQRDHEHLRDRALAEVSSALEALQGRVDSGEGELHRSVEKVQEELHSLRDGTVPRLEASLSGAHHALSSVQTLAEEIRDRRLPILSGRFDALISRLHEELEATGGLVDRMLAGEPLAVGCRSGAGDLDAVPEAVRAASRRFAESFRGSRDEILNRVSEHLVRLRESAPVLDVGCGRGELLEVLQREGVHATGVDADPAMVESCRRRGLVVDEGDALEALAAAGPGSLGAVTAIHLVEHLPAAAWMRLVERARTALRPGGVLLIESPNPESLRVGAGLFWLDPTHVAPVHPAAAAFVARACGMEIIEEALLHPFPPEQKLEREGLSPETAAMAHQLDLWLSGPRDFLLVARRPPQG